MIRNTLALMALGLLIGCTANQPDFRRMSSEELLAYNSTVPLLDQVYCETATSTASYIRRRSCYRLMDLLSGLPGTLNTASSSTTRISPAGGLF